MAPADPLGRRLEERLARLREQGLERSLRPPSGIDLSSNDYLNLSADPRIVEAFAAGTRREGCGSTGSRLLRGGRASFEALERRFARFKGTEAALYFGSGYLANVAVLSTLPEAGDVVFSDERNHASIIDGVRLSRAGRDVFPHNDVQALAARLRGSVEIGGPGRVRFVVVESLFSMDGDFAPLADYAALCEETGAVLVVDEAHAVGVYGARGSGRLEELGIGGRVISVNPAGKALGASGAFVAAPREVVAFLMQRGRPFVFSTAPTPGLTDALEAALSIVEGEPERRARVRALAAYLRERLAAAGIPVPAGTSHVVPIMIGDNLRAAAVAEHMRAEGFDVRAIRPPTVPPGTARLRVSVNAALDEPTITAFVQTLAAAIERIGVCSAVSS